jgi:predicted hydrocarbon binding protein
MLIPRDEAALDTLIQRARDDVRAYHDGLGPMPGATRSAHVLIPTRVIGRDLPRILDEIAGPIGAAATLYRLGCRIGQADAAAFFARTGADEGDSLYRLLAGPFHFARAGYGDVEVLVLDVPFDTDFAVLWESERSFSAADAAATDGRRVRACHVQAGYAAGWCREATGLPIDAREMACRAEGVRRCRFLLSHADKLEARLAEPRFHRAAAEYPRSGPRLVAGT